MCVFRYSLRKLFLLAALSCSLFSSQFSLAQSELQSVLKVCTECHGDSSRPKDNQVPIIWGQNALYLQHQLIAYRSGQRDNQIMGSIAESLPKAQLREIALALSQQQWSGPKGEEPATPNAMALRSKASTLSPLGQCVACHTPDPSASDASIPRLWGQNFNYLLEQMRAFSQDDRTTSDVMSAVLKTIDKESQVEIAHFFSTH
jgi:cytochrome c553